MYIDLNDDEAVVTDPSGVISSWSQEGNEISVELNGGIAAATPVLGGAIMYPLRDRWGEPITGGGAGAFRSIANFWGNIFFETPFADATDAWAAIVLASSADLSGTYNYWGLAYDAVGGPETHYGSNTTGPFNFGGPAAHVGAYMSHPFNLGSGGALAPTRIGGMSYDSDGVGITALGINGPASLGTGQIYVGMAFGRQTAVAGSASAVIRTDYRHPFSMTDFQVPRR